MIPITTLFLLVLNAPQGIPTDSTRVPNDPYFAEQRSFYSPGGPVSLLRQSTGRARDTATIAPGLTLDAPRAWALTTGSRDIIVAVLDDGFFYRHEDIADNVWRNPGEMGTDAKGLARETNGVDDDGNGFVDDAVGWDFAFEDPDPDPYVFDGMDRSRIQPYWHSISALGIIGAKGDNGIGVAGINWNVALMLLKIGAQGIRRGEVDTARVGRAARAIRYAVDNGARVINWSGYVDVHDPTRLAPLRAAVAYAAAHGVLLVTGAGNDGKNLDQDQNCVFPQCFDYPNQVRVAEVGWDGGLYRYRVGGEVRGSNYGARRVEIAAIAANFTTFLQGGVGTYAVAGGTSNAGPVVAGVAALILSVRPDLTATDLKAVLMASAAPAEKLRGLVASGGVVNAYRALRLAQSR